MPTNPTSPLNTAPAAMAGAVPRITVADPADHTATVHSDGCGASHTNQLQRGGGGGGGGGGDRGNHNHQNLFLAVPDTAISPLPVASSGANTTATGTTRATSSAIRGVLSPSNFLGLHLFFTVGDAKERVGQIEGLLNHRDQLDRHIQSNFSLHDKGSGYVGLGEARVIVDDLCRLLRLPMPISDADFEQYVAALDDDKDAMLDEKELCSGFVAAFRSKVDTMRESLVIAERDRLSDDDALPQI